MNTFLRGPAIGAVASVAILLGCASAAAQFSGPAKSSKGPANPNDNTALFQQLGVPQDVLAQQTQLTTQQLQQIAQLRALQSRRRGQVRTGVPQFIQMGPQGMMGFPSQPYNQQQDVSAKSSTQKRIEARQARDEQKKAAREAAKEKAAKAKNAKDKNGKAKTAKDKKVKDSKAVKKSKTANSAVAKQKPAADRQ